MQHENHSGKRYFVTRKMSCPECRGKGSIARAWTIHTSGIKFKNNAGLISTAESSHAQNRCEMCEGLGEVKTDVSFIEALVETLKELVSKKKKAGRSL